MSTASCIAVEGDLICTLLSLRTLCKVYNHSNDNVKNPYLQHEEKDEYDQMLLLTDKAL